SFDLGLVKLLVCEENNCLTPQKVPLKAEFKISERPAQNVEEKHRAEVESILGGALPLPDPPVRAAADAPKTKSPAAGRPVAPPAATLSDHIANLEKIKEQLPKYTEERKSFLNFILTAMFWGLVSLVTPCVFPMIPITVSFFLKQSAKEHH